jgi:gamma-glutamyltranspeptidase/glutathione hydrolase
MMRLLLVALCLLLPSCTSVPDAGSDPFAGGCVAADHEIASKAGAEILAKGGNAVDAAVATSFTLSVVRPYSCGIGGGGFMVIYFSDEGLERQKSLGRTPPRSIALNYREMAPAAVTPDYYERLDDTRASTYGGKAVAIPGTVAGLLHALDNYGTLDLATVLAPAIRAAEVGFDADAHYAAAARDLTRKFDENPGWKDRFEFVWKRYLLEGKVKAGDRIHIPEQARALRLIAEHGTAGFQAGEAGKAIVEAVRNDGGELTVADLVTFRVAESEPLSLFVHDANILTVPPPSSGGLAMLETLQVLQPLLPDPPQSAEGLLSPDYLHPLVECFKNAFADRARHLADPDFAPVPVREILDRSMSFYERYNPAGPLPQDQYGSPDFAPGNVPDDGGTSHLSVVDADGSAVACTETINLEFGSLIAVPEFGFVLNNEMDDFTTRRGQANAFNLVQSDRNLPEPGKRSLSSMTPTIVLKEGRVEIVAGASGGPRIITSTTQCILAALFNPAASTISILETRRIHHQWQPDVLQMEHPTGRMNLDTGDPHAELLRLRGHNVEYRQAIGEVQMIRRRPDGSWDPACDPRKGGRPAGVPR